MIVESHLAGTCPAAFLGGMQRRRRCGKGAAECIRNGDVSARTRWLHECLHETNRFRHDTNRTPGRIACSPKSGADQLFADGAGAECARANCPRTARATSAYLYFSTMLRQSRPSAAHLEEPSEVETPMQRLPSTQSGRRRQAAAVAVCERGDTFSAAHGCRRCTRRLKDRKHECRAFEALGDRSAKAPMCAWIARASSGISADSTAMGGRRSTARSFPRPPVSFLVFEPR